MIKDLKHPDPEIRRNAILVLEHATPDASTETVPAFAESLKDLDAFVREVAARNLYGIGPRAQTAMPSLIAAMRDPQAEVRGYSALALGKIGAKSATALAALIRGIDDEEEDVRIVVVRALGSIGPDAASAAPKLKAVLKGASPQDQLRYETERSLAAILKSPQ